MTKLTLYRHPIRSEREVFTVPPGASIADALRAAGEHDHDHVAAWIDGRPVPVDVVLEDGQTAIVRRQAGIEALVYGIWVGLTYLGVGAGVAAYAAWAIAIGIVVFAARLLFKPPSRPDGQQTGSARFTPRGFRNQQRPYEPVTVVLGQHRVFPDLAARPYYEVRGGQLYQRHLFLVSRNKCNLSSLRIGDVPILEDSAVAYTGKLSGTGVFEDVEIEIRQDWDPDTTTENEKITIYGKPVQETPVNVRLRRGRGVAPAAWVTRRTPPGTTRIEVQYEWPGGAYAISKHGSLKAVTITCIADYRSVDADEDDPWSRIAVRTLNSNIKNTLRASNAVDVTEGQYDVRVRRVTGFIGGYATVIDDTYFSILRSFGTGKPVRLSGCTLVAMSIRHTNQLNELLSDFNCIATSVMDDWNGSTWAEAATSNPASHLRFVFQGNAGRRTVADSKMDLTQLQAFHDRCAPGAGDFECNTVITQRSLAHDLAERIANVGRASFSFSDALYSVVIDDPDDTTPVQLFTPRNVRGFTGQRQLLDETHALKVRFYDAEADWQEAERVVYNDGYTAANATTFEDLDAWAVTDSAQAYKLGRWTLAIATLRNERFRFTCDFEHLKVVRGSVVRLAHFYALIGGQHGRITAVGTSGTDVVSITLDETCVMEAGKTYEVRIRRPDATVLNEAITLSVGETKTLTFASAIPNTEDQPEVGDLVTFGEYDTGSGLENSLLCRVAEIHPSEQLRAELVLEPLAASAHDADTGTIPTYQPNIQLPPDRQAWVPPRIGVRLRREGETKATPRRQRARRASITLEAQQLGRTRRRVVAS